MHAVWSISCLLHYCCITAGCCSAWPHATGGCRAPSGLLLLCASGCVRMQGFGGKKRGLCGLCAREWGSGDAPKVIEASSGSGMSLVLLRKSRTQQNASLPPPASPRALLGQCLGLSLYLGEAQNQV